MFPRPNRAGNVRAVPRYVRHRGCPETAASIFWPLRPAGKAGRPCVFGGRRARGAGAGRRARARVRARARAQTQGTGAGAGKGAGAGAGRGQGQGRGAQAQARALAQAQALAQARGAGRGQGAGRRRGHRRGRGQGHGRGRFYAKTGAHKKSRAAALFVCPAKRPRALSGHKKKNKTARRITPQARGIPKRHSSVAPLPRSRRAVRRRRRQALRAGRRCFPKRGPGPGTVPRAGRRRGRTRRGALSPPARACAAQAAPTVWARAGRATAWPPQSSRFPRR